MDIVLNVFWHFGMKLASTNKDCLVTFILWKLLLIKMKSWLVARVKGISLEEMHFSSRQGCGCISTPTMRPGSNSDVVPSYCLIPTLFWIQYLIVMTTNHSCKQFAGMVHKALSSAGWGSEKAVSMTTLVSRNKKRPPSHCINRGTQITIVINSNLPLFLTTPSYS